MFPIFTLVSSQRISTLKHITIDLLRKSEEPRFYFFDCSSKGGRGGHCNHVYSH